MRDPRNVQHGLDLERELKAKTAAVGIQGGAIHDRILAESKLKYPSHRTL